MYRFHVKFFLNSGGGVGLAICEHLTELLLGSINPQCPPPVHLSQCISPSLVQPNYTQFALRTHNGQIKRLVWHAATGKGFEQSTGTLKACLPKQRVSK